LKSKIPLVGSLSSGKNDQDASAEKKKTEKSRLIVSVTGMDCTTCALAIEKQVKKMEGIDDVKTAIMLNKIFIDYDPSLVDSTAIRKAIDKTGYKSYMAVEEKRRKVKT
jgi:Cu+-exporting ATPase